MPPSPTHFYGQILQAGFESNNLWPLWQLTTRHRLPFVNIWAEGWRALVSVLAVVDPVSCFGKASRPKTMAGGYAIFFFFFFACMGLGRARRETLERFGAFREKRAMQTPTLHGLLSAVERACVEHLPMQVCRSGVSMYST